MFNLNYRSFSTIFISGLMLLAGCATKPVFLHKEFSSDKVGRIAILPFLDARQRPDPEHDFKYFGSEASALLVPEIKYKRKYLAFDTTDIGDVAEYSAHAIEPSSGHYASPEYVRQLGPHEAKWILVPVCENLGRWNILLAAGGSAKVSLYLFNKETGQLWWKGAAQNSQQVAGPLSVLLVEAGDKFAFETGALVMSGHAAMTSLPQVKGPITKGGGDWIAQHHTIQNATDLQRIAVTPLIDGRRRESRKISYDPEGIEAEILKVLRDKGYDPVAVQGFGKEQTVSKDQVALGDAAFGKSLAGLGSKYVLVPVADDASKSPAFGKHYELSYYLFNTETGELIWEGGSFGRSIGKAMLALDKGEGLPKRKGPKK